MNWLVRHIVSGQVFFTGVILVLIAAFASTRSKPLYKRVTILAFLIGVLAIVISSTAISYWYYALAAIITLAWIVSNCLRRWRRGVTVAFAVVWLVAALIELPYHFTPSLSPAASRDVTIIGDSVTAGVGGDEKSETWPRILAREHDLIVQDISHMGDTAASALKRVRAQGVHSPVVVVEIGGNDLLGSTTASQFALDLNALLTQLTASDRQIVMFELPLPPFCYEYGRIQRSIAKKHHVKLIPRRVFASALAGSDSTLDSIHLSQTGHQRMADIVWGIVQSAFPTKSAAQFL